MDHRTAPVLDRAATTSAPAKWVEPYLHDCGAAYDRITLPEAPKRYKLNICRRCYQFMANADASGHAFYYQDADVADQDVLLELQC